MAGLGIQALAGSFDRLPADLRIPASAQASYVYANDGTTLITAFYDENRTEVPLSEIAPVMQQAIVAAEDARFYQHGGVDLKSVVRALVANRSSGGISQGASTLTMQYVRNVLKDDPNLTEAQRQAATADTAARKIQEVRYATALETRMSKQEILDRYLNISYFGDGAYGIDAASRTYFSKPPSQLTLPEAALLAGIVRSPDTENPLSGDRQAALSRRSYVLNSMAKMKVISAEQAAQAAAEPLVVRPSQTPNDCTAVSPDHNDWGFFCDYLRQWWDTQPAFGTTVDQREQTLRRGGYRIVTALDPTVQASALKQALGVYGYGNRRALPTAVVQPGTGRVLALAVNRHYSRLVQCADDDGRVGRRRPCRRCWLSSPRWSTTRAGQARRALRTAVCRRQGRGVCRLAVPRTSGHRSWPATGAIALPSGHWKLATTPCPGTCCSRRSSPPGTPTTLCAC